VWCDITVRDLDRAIKFYSAVLGRDVNAKRRVLAEPVAEIILFGRDDRVWLALVRGEAPNELQDARHVLARGRSDRDHARSLQRAELGHREGGPLIFLAVPADHTFPQGYLARGGISRSA